MREKGEFRPSSPSWFLVLSPRLKLKYPSKYFILYYMVKFWKSILCKIFDFLSFFKDLINDDVKNTCLIILKLCVRLCLDSWV